MAQLAGANQIKSNLIQTAMTRKEQLNEVINLKGANGLFLYAEVKRCLEMGYSVRGAYNRALFQLKGNSIL